ncbi:MAG: D-glycero-beta-D-manno-heptose 1,7-bisphosphate 7-phosphatase [Thermodesulfobacteriota bacterium]|nr:D-glycero-beta-D-manno-heptose 1,7-bisphosphate 7-phosphatase [Thermodesulfobacteriota bacterium]
MNKRKLTRVVFLDKDGVINVDSPDYIKSWAEVTFIPGSLEALRRLADAGFTVILITNQSGINRGLMTRETLDYMLVKMAHMVANVGGCITDAFYCPHAPGENCDCRKPRPGLIQKACDAYAIDLFSACMIGDNAKDIECGLAAGCGCTILVRTGNGTSAEKELNEKGIVPAHTAADLLEAARWLTDNTDSDPAA